MSWSKDYWLTCLSCLFFYFGFQMILPTLPVDIIHNGGDNVLVGLITGVITMVAVLFRPLVSLMLAMVNRRIVGLIGFGAAALASFFFTLSASVGWMIVSSALLGIGWGMMTVTLGTLVADQIPSERQGEGIGTYMLFGFFSVAVGPLAGQWAISAFGAATLFVLTLVSFLIAMLIAQFISYKKVPKTNSEAGGKSSAIQNLYEKTAVYPAFLIFLFMVSYAGIISFVNLFGQQLGYAQLGWYFLLNSVAAMLVKPIISKVFDRKGPAYILIPGAILGIAGLIILSYSTGLIGISISAVIYGMSIGFLQTTGMAWTLKRAAPEKRGAANSTYFIGLDLGVALGSFGLGFVAKITDYATMFRLSTILLALFLVLFIAGLARKRSL